MNPEVLLLLCPGGLVGAYVAIGLYSQHLNRQALANRIQLRPRIPVEFPATNSALAASFERDAENLELAGAHDAAKILRNKVRELDSKVKLTPKTKSRA